MCVRSMGPMYGVAFLGMAGFMLMESHQHGTFDLRALRSAPHRSSGPPLSRAGPLLSVCVCAAAQHESKDYVARLQAVEKVSDACWSEEREVLDVNTAELEQSVFRVRRKELHDDIRGADGAVFCGSATAVQRALPIVELEKYKPQRA